jgi:sensor histidine kinase regulating citrate/malate metabolism
MLKRLYYRLLLATLPSVETTARFIASAAVYLDKLTDLIERHIEEQAVKFANDVAKHRAAVEAMNDAMLRRATQATSTISSAQAKAFKASSLRESVQALIDRP